MTDTPPTPALALEPLLVEAFMRWHELRFKDYIERTDATKKFVATLITSEEFLSILSALAPPDAIRDAKEFEALQARALAAEQERDRLLADRKQLLQTILMQRRQLDEAYGHPDAATQGE